MVVKSRKLEQGAATRAALVAAARPLFGGRGYAGTSLEDIVRSAGVTKGALYHHFADKEQLFRTVAEEIKRETTATLSRLFLEADPFATLDLGCQAILDAYLDPAVRQVVWVDARAVLGAGGYRELQARYEPVFLRAALRRAMREGVIEQQPLRPLAVLLTGALGEACTLVAEAADPIAVRDEVGQVVTRLLAGLRPDRGPGPGRPDRGGAGPRRPGR